MYQYTWDAETGGLLLTSEISKFSKEPRPVYYRELDILGFDAYWNYPRNDEAPIMWAEANNYIYRGRKIASTKGGSLYTRPELVVLEESPEPDGMPLRPVDVEEMCRRNADLMETLVQETIQKIYNTYLKYRDRIDVFYVAFSGGKDSVVTLDLVQRALPHDQFKVLFGDTQMEFPDTYSVVNETERMCDLENIAFYRAKSICCPQDTWKMFGPPATSIRWCCNVHKTSPQIIKLRSLLDKDDFTGMAFTGIRADESSLRSTYEEVSVGEKHSGQYSFHPILDWNSAEVFLHIYTNGLCLNKAYTYGNVRAGCLVCPNSTGKTDYLKRVVYTKEMDAYLSIIASTSGKQNYTQADMQDFIDAGYWRTRRSGAALNYGHDQFESYLTETPPRIIVRISDLDWVPWARTIGSVVQESDNRYLISYKGKLYNIIVERQESGLTITVPNASNTKEDIHFLSLLRSSIIKSIYCVACGECEAECEHGAIHCDETGIHINADKCKHCMRCHQVSDHCLHYYSIKNPIKEATKMKGRKLSGYDGHAPRQAWFEAFVKYEGKKEFWETDGDGLVPNKKKEKFASFLLDAGVIEKIKQDTPEYTKFKPTKFGEIVIRYGADSEEAWALMLSNAVYTADFNWYATHLDFDTIYTTEMLREMLIPEMPNDTKGHGKDNVIWTIRNVLAKTPLGTSHIFGACEVEIKNPDTDREKITLISLQRASWSSPIPEVILYSLYKFAEACGDYYQFSLSTLMDDSIERSGVSPTRIFGLDRDTMVRLLNGLSSNYPGFINASFTLDLETITLNPEKTSADVLNLL